MPLKQTFWNTALILASVLPALASQYEISTTAPPVPAREFRGVWIATVGNIDWPSKPALSTAAQKAELVSILDRAAQMKLNAVVLQVRPACDALYASPIEPWSEYLTGTMGKAPKPFYDPLAFAIEEAHKRGLEFHAWFNPYRALHKSHEGTVSPNHISKLHPELVRRYGQYLWLDPGEREVQDYSLSVVMDVVKRYDVDGIHFDDYFYPDRADSGTESDFPDQASWKKFGVSENLRLDDWRRQNVNTFLQRVYASIKAAKPWVKFGVSPAGIWRPGFPQQIKGKDAYSDIFADSKKWLANGWLDYCSPQLYWRIDPRDQSFPVLLDWWAEQNVKSRHLWPGISAAYASSMKWSSEEIPNQVSAVRSQPRASGFIFYSASALFSNANLVQVLKKDFSAKPALVPSSPWLNSNSPARPRAFASGSKNEVKVTWNSNGTNSIRWWVIQTATGGDWQMHVLPSEISSESLNSAPDAIAVTAVDRFGNASAPRALQLKRSSSNGRDSGGK
jgi:uncharacterized lipoprotein YddW (UPF0748 family)